MLVLTLLGSQTGEQSHFPTKAPCRGRPRRALTRGLRETALREHPLSGGHYLVHTYIEASFTLQSAFQPPCESLPATELNLTRCNLMPWAENFLSTKVKKFLYM